MQKKVVAEGEKEEELFEKFMCYCKNGKGALESSIEQAKQTNDQLKSRCLFEADESRSQTSPDRQSCSEDSSGQGN